MSGERTADERPLLLHLAWLPGVTADKRLLYALLDMVARGLAAG